MQRRSARPTGRHRVAGLVSVVVATAIVAAGVPAAVAIATEPVPVRQVMTASPRAAQPSASVRSARATPEPRATRAPSKLQGWGRAPERVRAHGAFRAEVRTTGSGRVVRLERLVHHRWRVVDRARSTHAGRASLAWRAPKASGRVVLRVHVLRTDEFRAAVSHRRVVRVRRAAAPSTTPTTSAVPVPTPSTTPPATPTTTTAPTSADEARRAELLRLVNEARASARSCGGKSYPSVPALVRSDPADRAANDYATAMATQDFFSHTGPDGSTPGTRLAAVGVRDVAWAENIAAGQSSPATVMASWLGSAGHCANIMNPSVKRVGFGYAASTMASYPRYWVQLFAG